MTFGFVPFVNWTTFFCPEEAYTDDGRGPVMYDLCPSISTTISTMGIPIYLWILSSCLMTISLLFALTNWTVIILAIAKNKTYCPSLFLRDGVYNKTIGTICWFYSLIGLGIIITKSHDNVCLISISQVAQVSSKRKGRNHRK